MMQYIDIKIESAEQLARIQHFGIRSPFVRFDRNLSYILWIRKRNSVRSERNEDLCGEAHVFRGSILILLSTSHSRHFELHTGQQTIIMLLEERRSPYQTGFPSNPLGSRTENHEQAHSLWYHESPCSIHLICQLLCHRDIKSHLFRSHRKIRVALFSGYHDATTAQSSQYHTQQSI